MKKLIERKGQMTVEFCVVIPVLLLIALLLVNALSFVSETAKFDRIARNSVRVYASSQGRGEELEQAKASIEEDLKSAFSQNNEETECESFEDSFGLKQIRCKLSWQPTLFGLGLKDEILGVSTPKLVHEINLTLDKYKLFGAIG